MPTITKTFDLSVHLLKTIVVHIWRSCWSFVRLRAKETWAYMFVPAAHAHIGVWKRPYMMFVWYRHYASIMFIPKKKENHIQRAYIYLYIQTPRHAIFIIFTSAKTHAMSISLYIHTKTLSVIISPCHMPCHAIIILTICQRRERKKKELFVFRFVCFVWVFPMITCHDELLRH